MGLLDRLRGLVSRTRGLPSGVSVQDGLVVTTASGVRGAARRGTRELIAAYREQPWLRAVASRIARGVASIQWEVLGRAATPGPAQLGARMRRGPGGMFRDVAARAPWDWGVDRSAPDDTLGCADYQVRARRRRELAKAGLLREVEGHPALKVLANPNPYMTGHTAMKATVIYLDLKGEAFWLLDLDGEGKPRGFLPVPPHWVTQCPTVDQPWFRISFAGLQLTVKPEAVVWLRDVDPENPYGRGTGVAESLGDELETDEAAAKYMKAFFTNGAIPSFLVAFEGAQPDQLKRAQEKWELDARGAGNAHRAYFAPGKMNAQRLDNSFKDTQLIELRKHDRDTIAQVFAMPPELLGIIENSNRSTIDAARYIYVLGVEWPRAEFLRSELQAQFLSRWDPNLVLEAEVEVPEDEERRLAAMGRMPGAFSLNEWRAAAGAPPRDGWDDVFPPLSLPGQDGPKPEAQDGEEPAPEDGAEEPPEADGEARVHRLPLPR